jgi:DNA-binding YbaB/EbfC family protein
MAKPGSIGSNFGNILRQAQKMQGQLAKIQEEHGELTFEGAAGGGMVKATVTGKNEVVRIDVDREKTDVTDLDLLLDLVAAAVNDGVRRAHDDLEQKTQALTGGISIPGLT